MLLDEPGGRRFGALISIDGSFWNQTQMIYDLEQGLFNATRSLPVALYLAAAENEPSITAFRQRVEARAYQGLRMREQPYSLSHAAVLAPGLQDGLAFVFAGN